MFESPQGKSTPRLYKNYVAVIFAITLLGGCSAASRNPYGAAAPECSKNFEVAGTALLGQSFRTQAIIRGAAAAEVFEQVKNRMRREGFIVEEVDARSGLIRARSRTTSNNLTEPTVIGIEPDGSDVRIIINFRTVGGQYAPEEGVHKEFCDIIADAGRLTNSRMPVKKPLKETRASGSYKQAPSKTGSKPARGKEEQASPPIDESIKNRY